MDAASRELARKIWRQLADRNQWQLFPNEEQLLDDVLAALSGPVTPDDAEGKVRPVLQRLYSQRLYEGVRDREERAASELWLMFLRLAVRGGAREQDASDLAQEAVARVIAKLGQVKSPQAFQAWALMVFRTTKRDLRPKHPEQPLTSEDGEAAVEPADPADLVAEVEGRLAEQEFRDLLRAAVPNDLERFTLLRCVVFGDDPRDVARDLGLPLHRTRVAKSRALQRLRDNNAFMAFISSLDPLRSEAAPMTGGQSHE